MALGEVGVGGVIELKEKPSSVAMNSRILLLPSPWQLQLPWVSL